MTASAQVGTIDIETPSAGRQRWPGDIAEMYRDHHQAVLRAACRLVGADAAADIAQDVFMMAWSHPERFDPRRGSLRSYLLVIARNTAIDRLRSQTARRRRDRQWSFDRATPADDRRLDDDDRRLLDRALAALRPDEREAITTTFFGRCTYREAAVLLAIPEGTVKSRIRSGLRKLHASLGIALHEGLLERTG